jgi:ABC-type uncharacterized transport system ATPase subunit
VTDSGDLALALTAISKRYGSQLVLDGVSLQLRRGTVHALLGENGAGKTTLMRVAFGMVQPDAGSIRMDGREIHLPSPADAIRAGVGMVHQHFTLVPSMTVAENLALGGRGPFNPQQAALAARRIADATGFALDPRATVGTLPVGAQQRVEIAKALARDARVLVLDEPTAVLAPAETDELLRWLRSFAERGNAAVLITHKLREALAVADDVTVLRRGRLVQSGASRDATTESLTRAMLGTAPPESTVRRAAVADRPSERIVFRADRITARGVDGRPRLREATFALRGGEIVGVAGVEGAGQRELLRVLAGRHVIASGTLDGPCMVGFVPEDRHRDAVLLDRPLTENVVLRGAGRRRGMLSWSGVRRHTASLLDAFDVRAADVHARMRTLSGGNQQKLVLAREMDERAGDSAEHGAPLRAIVAENPTRGLDVRAGAEVHARLRAARDRGATVVVYSSDLEEVLALATRVLVVYDGQVREVPPDRDMVGRAMLGLA